MTVATTTFASQVEAQAAAKSLSSDSLVVASKTEQVVTEAPPPPYDTAALLADTAERLQWNAVRVMETAQSLFEGIELYGVHTGLITYHRTDSQQVAPEAQQAAREVITRLFGSEALPGQVEQTGSRGKVSPTWWLRLAARLGWQRERRPFQPRPSPVDPQPPHEAIRPTDPTRTPDALQSHLDDDRLALYSLIWARFIASQMKAAKYRVTTVQFVHTVSNSVVLDIDGSNQNGAY